MILKFSKAVGFKGNRKLTITITDDEIPEIYNIFDKGSRGKRLTMDQKKTLENLKITIESIFI